MMNSDHPVKPATLSAALVADRMGLTTRQLQDLRLRGIGPQIVQRSDYLMFTGSTAVGRILAAQCGQKLIGRDWYTLGIWNLTADGRCNACGTPCAGVFEAEPGVWGARRRPVRLRQYAD